jgi:hypothetical protein
MSEMESGPVGHKIKKVRLEKFDNDPKTGEPIREAGPVEIWEGEDESDMQCIFRKGEN